MNIKALLNIKQSIQTKNKNISTAAFTNTNPDFDIVALGTRSGVNDGNLTSYMIRPINSNEAVLCDAGTLGNGLKIADSKGTLNNIPIMPDSALSRAGHVLKQTIRAYLISHAHLDHIAGLVLSSPDDNPKPIYALPSTRENLSKHLFNNKIWGNQANRGSRPSLGKYEYVNMEPDQEQTIPNTNITIKAWPLTHGSTISTAFLIESKGKSILYLGDTEVDKPKGNTQNLRTIWKKIAPLVHKKCLKAIIMEATFDNSRPDNALNGHMTPKHVLQSLQDLALECGGRHHVRGLNVIITHVKETFIMNDKPVQKISEELNNGNDMGILFLMAEQGEHYLV